MGTAPLKRHWRVRGLELAYHELGPAEAPPLLLLHGFLDHGLSFLPVATALSDRYRLILPDFRGHGASGWVGAGGTYVFTDYYPDVLALIRGLGLSRFGLVAHSMGGAVALVVAGMLGEAVEGLILLEGMGAPEEAASVAPARVDRFVRALERDGVDAEPEERRRTRRPMKNLEEAALRIRSTNPRLSHERALELAALGSEPFPAPDDEARVWRFDPLHRVPSARPFSLAEFEAHLARVQVPVLSLLGQDSEFQLSEFGERHRHLSDVRVALVPGAGHNLHHDRPDAIAAAIECWFGGDRRGPLPAVLEEALLAP